MTALIIGLEPAPRPGEIRQQRRAPMLGQSLFECPAFGARRTFRGVILARPDGPAAAARTAPTRAGADRMLRNELDKHCPEVLSIFDVAPAICTLPGCDRITEDFTLFSPPLMCALSRGPIATNERFVADFAARATDLPKRIHALADGSMAAALVARAVLWAEEMNVPILMAHRVSHQLQGREAALLVDLVAMLPEELARAEATVQDWSL